MVLSRLFILLLFINICYIPNLEAEETDQFTLPPNELVDIGPDVSCRLYDVLEKILIQTNTEMQRLEIKARHNRHAAKKLALLKNGNHFADLVYQKTGPGFPRWLRTYPLTNHEKPMKYKEPRPWKTVYWLVFSQSPFSLIGLTPTINMYDHYFGTDKLGHFFMQGHTYYTVYNFLLAHGKSAKEAQLAIIRYGQIIEQTYLGTLVNGVYSNGDLSANYAGWKFYMNLAHSIKIGPKKLPPMLVLKGNTWAFAQQVNRNNLLKPYLSDNLNEALNPSHYLFMRSQIQKQVKKRCEDWIRRKNLTEQDVKAQLVATSRWHGENYGHWLPKNRAVTLAICFEKNKSI